MEMQEVKSSQLKSVGYDPDAKRLAIIFQRGDSVYFYDGVEGATHKELLEAESIGKHFNRHIKALPFTKEPIAAAPTPETPETPDPATPEEFAPEEFASGAPMGAPVEDKNGISQ